MLAVNDILVEVPLHIVLVAALETTGIGLTVTVIIKEVPMHEPPVDVGVITYSTVPVSELLGLVSV